MMPLRHELMIRDANAVRAACAARAIADGAHECNMIGVPRQSREACAIDARACVDGALSLPFY